MSGRVLATIALLLTAALVLAACDPLGGSTQRIDNLSGGVVIVKALRDVTDGGNTTAITVYSAKLEPDSTIAGYLATADGILRFQVRSPSCALFTETALPASAGLIVIGPRMDVTVPPPEYARKVGLADRGSTFGLPVLC